MCIRSGFLLALLLGALPTLQADILYSVTDLGSINGFHSNTQGRAINNAGQVTGGDYLFSPGTFHAFLYNNGVMKDLGTPRPDHPDDLTWGFSINNLGQVIGEYSRGDGFYHHVFLYSQGVMTDLGQILGSNQISGYEINDAGQITGAVDTGRLGDDRVHGFIYSNGSVLDLGGSIYPTGINNAGQFTGGTPQGHAFLYSQGQITDLGTLGGDTFSQGMSINDAGQVTGSSAHYADGTRYQRAFLYSDGVMTDLGTLGGNVAGFSINNKGQVVGSDCGASYFCDVGGVVLGKHAFLYSHGQMYDLNDLINPALRLTLNEATAINDSGQIVANDNMNFRAYLLTPVPEPSTWALCGVALLGLGAWVRLCKSHA